MTKSGIYATITPTAGQIPRAGTDGRIDPLWVSATLLLDQITSIRGSILVRGSGNWIGLQPGNSGFPLLSNGAGADPSYGRLSFSALGQNGATSGQVPQWNGTQWVAATVSSGGGGTVNSGSQYQFGYYAAAGTAISGSSVLTTDATNRIVVTTNASGTNGIILNNTVGSPTINLQIGGVSKTQWGVAQAANQLITGAVADDFCLVNTASKPIRLSTDNGSTSHLVLAAANGDITTNTTGTASGVIVNANSGYPRIAHTFAGGTAGGFWFSSKASGDAITGSVAGDSGFRNLASKAWIFSTDNGTSIGFSIQANNTGLFIKNMTTPGTPSGGGVVYVSSGALRYKGSSGTDTLIAAA